MLQKLELGTLVTLVLAAIAFAFNLGGFNNKLDGFEKRITTTEERIKAVVKGEKGDPGAPGTVKILARREGLQPGKVFTDFISNSQTGILLVTARASARRPRSSVPPVNAGVRVTIRLNNTPLAANQEFEGELYNGTFVATATAAHVLPPAPEGGHRIEAEIEPNNMAEANELYVEYVVLGTN